MHGPNIWQEHALGEILWQLKYSVGADGSWPECVRYHAAVLTKLFSSASALEQIDYSTILNGRRVRRTF